MKILRIFMGLIRYIFMLAFFMLTMKIIIYEVFDLRPFNFERYTTGEQFKQAAQQNFPLGSDINKIIERLKESGAECHQWRASFENLENRNISASCKYFSGFISWHPRRVYTVWLHANENRKLIRINTQKSWIFDGL